MSKYIQFVLMLMVLVVPTGCQTVHGMGEDIHNATNPKINGWNAIKKADEWQRENLW